MGICFNVSGWFYMSSMGLGSAANTRVANELGAGRPRGARNAFRVSFLLSATMQLVFGATLWVYRNDVVRIFSDDDVVVDHVDRITPILCAAIIGDGE